MAESFIDSRATTPLLQKFKFTWHQTEIPQNTNPSSMTELSSTTTITAFGASTSLAEAVSGVNVDNDEDKDEEPQDLDVADDDDDIWRG